ncbi:hypothetical protein [Belnapia moabensis]|uniref:hypothetical protein n=1 Tax=Belnapia moabensis TaxID=365533 RepID=UPI0005BC9DEC|nr:hypothetical protein [Belnapia moabensis]
MRLHAARCGDYGDPDEERPDAVAVRARIEDVRAATGSTEEMRQMVRSVGDYIRIPAHRRAQAATMAPEPQGRRA